MSAKPPKKKRQRKLGRPSRTGRPTQTIGVRLARSELRAIDAAAKEVGLTRSEFVRRAAARAAAKVTH